MEDAKSQLLQKLQGATNILVTVSSSPSVDQLTACIGMTLWLNKIGKHATAVFSGDIPNALEFLQPEATIEKTTDSLRDFIIALDKSKADKLRYKVEDRVVKIFITPYRTSLSSADLEFSQGDFNVDAIVAIGVSAQEDLDNAIVAHGRILHDATVTTINTTKDGGLGSINWHEPSASSLSELVYELCQGLDANQIDPQIATALLTGIVAETSRFSNNKTTPHTMSVSATLMSAGANQQLIANKLEDAEKKTEAPTSAQPSEEAETDAPEDQTTPKDDGSLEIEHEAKEEEPSPTDGTDSELKLEIPEPELKPAEPEAQPEPEVEQKEAEMPPIEIPAEPEIQSSSEDQPPEEQKSQVHSNQSLILEPPSRGGTFTASTREEDLDQPESPLNLPPVDNTQLIERQPLGQPEEAMPASTQPEPLIGDKLAEPEVPEQPTVESKPVILAEQPPAGPAPFEQPDQRAEESQTLSDLEKAVSSPHIDLLRDRVEDALKSGPQPEPGPVEALNAVNVDLNPQPVTEPESTTAFNPDNFEVAKHDEVSEEEDPNAPPQVPPPIVPPDFLPPAPPPAS